MQRRQCGLVSVSTEAKMCLDKLARSCNYDGSSISDWSDDVQDVVVFLEIYSWKEACLWTSDGKYLSAKTYEEAVSKIYNIFNDDGEIIISSGRRLDTGLPEVAEFMISCTLSGVA